MPIAQCAQSSIVTLTPAISRFSDTEPFKEKDTNLVCLGYALQPARGAIEHKSDTWTLYGQVDVLQADGILVR